MKVRKTSGADRTQKTNISSVRATAGERLKGSGYGDVTDTVSLSNEAIAAAKADAPRPVIGVEGTDVDGPLPDAHETSEAMLRKELERVFRLIYL